MGLGPCEGAEQASLHDRFSYLVMEATKDANTSIKYV